MSEPVMKALCCVCGNLRTYRRARNCRGNWGDQSWERSLGDLKCSECVSITTHALLDDGSDFDEKRQRIALGDQDILPSWDPQWRKTIRADYRRGLPRNPLTDHLWWKADEDAAREAGQKQFQAMCGELVNVPEQRREGTTPQQQRMPSQVKDVNLYEEEFQDPATGLWWRDGDCVDCLRHRHAWLLREHRKKLSALLIQVVAKIDDVDATMVEKLNELVASALPGGGS
ncbi:hypothetical protein A5719_03315 [Mycolicibacterium peregrinum]|uniref:hypothetical protein n=1 Tax=Mycolicibacterium peregrinum TaxID=43304 RepID=UPI0007EACD99|nr:hypothetical protein [Mycolicibacterium peregrinum]OBF42569.1 hypothetical protein A5719_03315 [Mycolicibacterium peregrinum]